MQKLKDTGTEWVRLDLTTTETSRECVKQHKNYGLKVLGIISTQTVENLQSLDHWRTIVQQTLDINGYNIDAVECWNEPDLPQFGSGVFQGQPDFYVQMLRILHEELDARNIDIPVVAGAISNLTSKTTYPSYDYGGYFLREIRRLGSDEYCDVYSVHGYRQPINKTPSQYDGRSIAGLYSWALDIIDNSKPVWITETGNGDSLHASANYMQTWFNQLLSVGCPFVCWYLFYGQGNYAMVNDDFSERPSYLMFQSFTSLPTPTPPILATVSGIIIGGGIGYVLNRKKPVVPIIVGAAAGGTVGYIIDRTLRS